MRPYLCLPDPLSDVILLKEGNYRDYCAMRDGSKANRTVFDSLPFQRECLRSANCQKIAFKAGTPAEYARLCLEFQRLGLSFPSPGMAEAVYAKLGPLNRYVIEQDRLLWHIKVNFEPDFGNVFLDDSWRLTTRDSADSADSVILAPFEIPKALELFSCLNGLESQHYLASFIEDRPAG